MPSSPLTATGLLRRAWRRNQRKLLGSVLLLIAWQLCETAVPVMIGVIIDRAVATGDLTALVWWGLAFCALFVVLSLGYRFGARLGWAAMNLEMHQLRVEISEHVLAPRGARTGLLPGEILSLATADTEMVGASMRMINHVIASTASLLLATFLLLRISPMLGLVVLIGAPVVLLIVQVVTPRIGRNTSAQQESIARATGVATDLIHGLRPLKGIGAEATAAARYRLLSQHAKRASIKTAGSYGVLTGLSNALSGCFLAVVALLAGRQAMTGDITVGELIAVVGLAQYLAEPLGAMGEMSAYLASSHASAGRIVSYLKTPPLIQTGAERPVNQLPTVELESVRTGPLNELSLATRTGEWLGIVATDPATADTLITVFSGELLDPERGGSITLGGIEYVDLRLDSLREHLIVSRHHADVFEGTLRSNIAPVGAITDARLDEVLDASAAGEVVALHEDGVEHATTADGNTLSGGQRQRLALARALAADPPILVLQEPTTAVDSVTEQHIAEGIRRLRHRRPDRTTVVLTSSPALLAQADRVLLVEEGRVVAEGDHSSLSTLPEYRRAVLR